MDLLEAHALALGEFDRRVRAITETQWANPTPDTEWTVRDLVSHLVVEQLWVPSLLAGATIEEVGDRFDGDVLGADPIAAWAAASLAAREAWLEPGATRRTVHLSFGDLPSAEYGWQMTMDLTVHAWDLARGIGGDEVLVSELCAAVLERARPMFADFSGSGLFAPPIPVPPGADDQTALLYLSGRRR